MNSERCLFSLISYFLHNDEPALPVDLKYSVNGATGVILSLPHKLNMICFSPFNSLKKL